jgi:hypothetical protein
VSDKPRGQLLDADLEIRRLCPIGMENGVKLTVEFFVGFELFNSRPYHNYETWSGGYRVSGPVDALSSDVVTVTAEDLDDALRKWDEARREALAEASG